MYSMHYWNECILYIHRCIPSACTPPHLPGPAHRPPGPGARPGPWRLPRAMGPERWAPGPMQDPGPRPHGREALGPGLRTPALGHGSRAPGPQHLGPGNAIKREGCGGGLHPLQGKGDAWTSLFPVYLFLDGRRRSKTPSSMKKSRSKKHM